MTQPLPCGKLEWLNKDELKAFDEQTIASYDRNSNVGYFLEVDCVIPFKLHDTFRDFPPMPEKMVVTDDLLSHYQLNLKEKFKIKGGKVDKLLTTLLPKKNYRVSNYTYLQFIQ